MLIFDEILVQVTALVQQQGRVSYRALKRRFSIDEEYLEDLKAEIIDAKRLAVDEDGKVLVWTGKGINGETDKGIKEAMEADGETANQANSETDKKSPEPRVQSLESKPVTYTPQHLAERIRAEQAALEARSGTDGERKTITALFADLKGSTALIEGLDPEEARAIIDPALQLMMDAVHRYEGYVAQVLGDGIFALFGAPIAHEDHPQRALYAALRMQEEMRRYGDQVRLKHGVPLAMRVGVNTGEVVMRSIRKDDLHADYVPVGHSTNLAARMEQMATPGLTLVTAYTHKLTEGYFAFKALGQTQIKGVEEPLSVYEVLGAGPLRTRLQVTATHRGLTRFVGRQSEMEQLRKALEQAKAGRGQIVGVMGEPGLGKSRLFYEFKLLSLDGCLVLEAYSVSHGKATTYLPVIELLKGYFDIQASDDERKRREKVIGKVLGLDRSLEDTLPYLFALLGIEEQPSPLQQMDPQIRRRRTFEALKKLFLRESLNQPLVLIFEDLHWIDGETQGVLDILGEGLASTKLLLLVNYRPEYRHEWGQKTYYTQLRLAPFGKAEAVEFLGVLLGTTAETWQATSLQQLKQLILEKTEGSPFFMEEIVQELFEQGVLARDAGGARHAVFLPTDLHLPATVQGILAARIDRLTTDEKDLLQQLAVIGREFPLSLVKRVVSQSEEELYRVLSSLQHKEFLYEQPAFPEVEYLFKHALTQEVAYNSVLLERRKALHEQTAQAMEQLYHERLEEHYNELAHHYSRSNNVEKAIAYFHKAGEQAVQRSAHVEAINHLTTALELLNTLPDTHERARQELMVQIILGVPLQITRGSGAPEVERVYTRARDLCQQLGETSQLFWVLAGLGVFYLLRGELQTSHEIAQQMLSLAQNRQDPTFLANAHRAVGTSLFWLGEFTSARTHLEQAIALYDSQQSDAYTFVYGFDHGVTSASLATHPLWYLGYPDQALKRSFQAVALARELTHPHSLAFALSFAARSHHFRGEGAATQERAEELLTLATEQGFAQWGAQALCYLGWVLTEQGRTEEGIAQIRQGITAHRATGAEVGHTYYLAWMAQALGKAKQAEEGLRVLAGALAVADKNGERHYEAELYRLRGELTLQKLSVVSCQLSIPSPQAAVEQEAEEYFLKAIDIAQKQHANSLELRAATSLARLWQQQSKIAEAHRMLSEIYNWFTEGFDTKDLQEAKALLESLESRS